jgi:hypothetical protein
MHLYIMEHLIGKSTILINELKYNLSGFYVIFE